MADTIAYKKSGDSLIDLLNGADDSNIGSRQWAKNNLTYAFPTSVSQYGAQYYETYGFEAASDTAKAMASEILDFYSSVSGLTFTPASDAGHEHSDLQFGASSTINGVASGYGAHETNRSGDVWFSPSINEYGYAVMVHEIGHVMGLNHAAILPRATYRTGTYTVMPSSVVGAQTLMVLDIAAIQHRYGANFDTCSGNTTYKWDPGTGEMYVDGVGQGTLSIVGGVIKRTIWDGNGNDTYDFSNFEVSISIDLRPGRWTTIDYLDGRGAGLIANALLYTDASGVEDARSLIENAVGGPGYDSITGNQADNMLNGGGGNDTIDGREGNDTIHGEDGNDFIDGGQGSDHLHGGSGNDVFAFVADPTGAVTDYIHDFSKKDDDRDIIDLSAVAAGVSAAGFAEWKSNYVSQSGNDTEIRFDDDRVVLLDTEASSLDYSDFRFDPVTIRGSEENDVLNGSSGSDLIHGLEGDDTLNGLSGKDTLEGGPGADTIHGGDGDDIIRVGGTDLIGDVIDGGEGVDMLHLTSTVTLSTFRPHPTGFPNNYRNIEILEGNGFGIEGTSDDDFIDLSGFLSVTGLALLDGADGNDTLHGSFCDDIIRGGAGADIIFGGFGNDTILVGGQELDGDEIDGGDGTDTLKLTSTVTAALFQAYDMWDQSGFWSIERLDGNGFSILGTDGNDHIDLQHFSSVTGVASIEGGAGDDFLRGGPANNLIRGGSGNDEIRGDDDDDVLEGGSGNDTIFGWRGNDLIDGGSGADLMRGGAGDDIYVVDNAGDIVDETASGSGGIDTVRSSFAYSLVPSATLLGSVENLTLTGDANIDGVGNSDDNIIIGNAGDNVLDGGDGNDTLLGGDGTDTLLGGNGNDVIDGGAGADIMRGGAGGDVYVVDNAGDIIDEAATGSGGVDSVRSSISYSLFHSATLLGSVENLTLIGNADINGTGNGANNVIIGNSGANMLEGDNGDDSLDGAAGNDTLFGDAGNDLLRGGGGTDWLFGGDGNDIMDGGPGGAAVSGGNGSDVYIFRKGYGSSSTISDNGSGTDRVQFVDIDTSGIVACWDGPDLELVIKATDEVLRIANQTNSYNHIENFTFFDGVTWSDTAMEATAKPVIRGTTMSDLLNGTSGGDVILGRAGSDEINGHAGDDTLIGSLGNDTLTGGAGNDSFIFAANFGKDVITDFDGGPGAGDVIEFHSSLFTNYESVLARAQQIESDVLIAFDTNNSLTLRNMDLSYLNADDFFFFL